MYTFILDCAVDRCGLQSCQLSVVDQQAASMSVAFLFGGLIYCRSLDDTPKQLRMICSRHALLFIHCFR
jgi:hypothetical protein